MASTAVVPLGVERDTALRFYRQMARIRSFEEAANELYRSAKMPGLTHLYAGRGGRRRRRLRGAPHATTSSRRRIAGTAIASRRAPTSSGCSPSCSGKEAGYCRGKGGSMHIADFEHGNLGANAIVGGSAGIATGAAQSAKMRGTDQVAVCFFGEGALGQGLLYEVMNMAALWELPVDLPLREQPLQRVHALLRDHGRRDPRPAAAFGIPGAGRRRSGRPRGPRGGVQSRRAGARRPRAVVRRREHLPLLRPPRRRHRPCVLPAEDEEADWAENRDPISRFGRRLFEARDRDRAELDEIAQALAQRSTPASRSRSTRPIPSERPGDRACLRSQSDAARPLARSPSRKRSNEALREELRRDPTVFVLGEDVAEAGTPFKVLSGLVEEFGTERVIDSPISEPGITGVGLGCRHHRHAAGRRHHVRRLPDLDHGSARQPGCEDPLHVGRPPQGAR